MKKQILFFLIAAASLVANAQKRNSAVTGYGAATAEINNINRQANLGVGAYGGVLLNHRWLIGAAGNNTFLKKTASGTTQKFQYHTYGLYTEFHISPQSAVHPVIGLMGGAGYLQQKQSGAEDKYSRVGEWHPVISPNLGLSVDVTSFMRIHTRASYNFSADPKTTAIAKENLRAVAGSISLVFGKF
jgi:hypothetical protein